MFGDLIYNGRRRSRRSKRQRGGFHRFRHTNDYTERLRFTLRSHEIECAKRSKNRNRCGESKSGTDTFLFSCRNRCDRGRRKATGKGSLPFRFLLARVNLFCERGRILLAFLGVRANHPANEISYKSWDRTGGRREPRARLSRRQG